MNIRDPQVYFSTGHELARPSMGRSRSQDPGTTCPAALLSDHTKLAPRAWPSFLTTRESKRMRCIMIVALARKLAIALWRYVELGLIPEGATLSAR